MDKTILLSQKIHRFYFLYSKLLCQKIELVDSCNQDLKMMFNNEKKNFNEFNKTSEYSKVMLFDTYLNTYFDEPNKLNGNKIPLNILLLKVCNTDDEVFINFIEKVNKYLEYILM